MIIFLKKSVISGISPSAILVAPWVREEEVAIVALSSLESFLESSLLTDGAMGGAGSWIVALAMEQGVETMQQAVESKGNGGWEGKSEIEEPKGLRVQKVLKSATSLRRNRDLTDPIVIKPIITIICLKCKEKFQYSCLGVLLMTVPDRHLLGI
jgi:hypothetical protein